MQVINSTNVTEFSANEISYFQSITKPDILCRLQASTAI